jgi:hypothetical protein
MAEPMTSTAHTEEPAPTDDGRRRLWLLAWLAGRPDIMANLLALYHRLTRFPAGRVKSLSRGAQATLAGGVLLLAMGAGALRTASIGAAAISVDSGIVVLANDSKCSLVEAILNANSNNQVFTAAGECPAGSGADVITLPGGAFNLLTAYGGSAFYSDNGLPPINSKITIEGNGAAIERDSTAPKFRILAVASSGSLILNDTTISGGATDALGGGLYVYNSGEATLVESTVFGNQAGNGGGVATKLGTVTLEHGTVSGNTAVEYGGGIHTNLGDVTLNNSTVSGNQAGNRGGGISILFGDAEHAVATNGSTIRGNTAGNGGGGVYQIGGMAALINSTISDNTATASNGGGFLNRGGTTTLTSSTITNNSASAGGGGLHEEHQLANVTLVRTLISGNSAADGDEVQRAADAGPMTTGDHNLFGHAGLTSAQAFANFSPGVTDILATSNGGNVALSDILADLNNNGGATFTHALVPGSPAIDGAPSADCLTITDQRGFGRNVNGDGQASASECDIGSFEYAAILATPSPIVSDTPTSTNTPTPSMTPSITTTPSATPTPTPTTGPSPTSGPSPTPSSTVAPTSTLPANLDWQVHVPVVVGGPPQ